MAASPEFNLWQWILELPPRLNSLSPDSPKPITDIAQIVITELGDTPDLVTGWVWSSQAGTGLCFRPPERNLVTVLTNRLDHWDFTDFELGELSQRSHPVAEWARRELLLRQDDIENPLSFHHILAVDVVKSCHQPDFEIRQPHNFSLYLGNVDQGDYTLRSIDGKIYLHKLHWLELLCEPFRHFVPHCGIEPAGPRRQLKLTKFAAYARTWIPNEAHRTTLMQHFRMIVRGQKWARPLRVKNLASDSRNRYPVDSLFTWLTCEFLGSASSWCEAPLSVHRVGHGHACENPDHCYLLDDTYPEEECDVVAKDSVLDILISDQYFDKEAWFEGRETGMLFTALMWMLGDELVMDI